MKISKTAAILLFFLSLMPFYSANAIDHSAMEMPQVQMIKLISFSVEQESAVFEVNVYNPNEYKLPVRALSGNIFLNERLVSSLEANSKKSLAPLSTQTFTVPVKVDVDATLQSANDIMLSGIADYEFNGYMMTPVGELPINESGRLTADQILTLLQAVIFSQSQQLTDSAQ